MKTLGDSAVPGEAPLLGDAFLDVQQKLDRATQIPNPAAALDALDLVLRRVTRALDGETARGSATLVVAREDKSDWSSLLTGAWDRSDSDRVTTGQLREGRFAFIGPEVYFLADAGGPVAVVRAKEGSKIPLAYALREFERVDAAPLFDGKLGSFPADASEGKALRLEQTRGTLRDHIEKGGPIAYALLVVGLISLVMVVQKALVLAWPAIGSRKARKTFLSKVAAGKLSDAQDALTAFPKSARALLGEGLDHFHAPRAALEGKLESSLLGLRLRAERRLPLLAVIATAAPLMGLLGTVMGMGKTFALISVFGTGNARKLASGISEVLVATESGLAVALPALVLVGLALSSNWRWMLGSIWTAFISPPKWTKNRRSSPAPIRIFPARFGWRDSATSVAGTGSRMPFSSSSSVNSVSFRLWKKELLSKPCSRSISPRPKAERGTFRGLPPRGAGLPWSRS